MTTGLLILGFGGHARSVADVALATGVQSLVFVDDNARDGEQFLGFPVRREFVGPMPEGWSCMPASGDNRQRKLQVEAARAAGWRIATLISPHATVGVGATIADGCFVAHHGHVGPMARIGACCIVNTGGIVEHECIVGDYVHVSVNTTVAGRCQVGDFVFLGAGATIIDGIAITGDTMVGAGSVVIASIDRPGTYVGAPAALLCTADH